MKKRSLSLLLSLVMLVVLMLGSCVSVLADAPLAAPPAPVYGLEVEGKKGENGFVLAGEKEIKVKATGEEVDKASDWTLEIDGAESTGFTKEDNDKKIKFDIADNAEVGTEYVISAVSKKDNTKTASLTLTVVDEWEIVAETSMEPGDTQTLVIKHKGVPEDKKKGEEWILEGNSNETKTTLTDAGVLTIADDEVGTDGKITVTLQEKEGQKKVRDSIEIEIVLEHDIYVAGGTADKESAKAGEWVKITVEKDDESIKGWETYPDDIEVVKVAPKTYIFQMPDEDVEIYAQYKYTIKSGNNQTWLHAFTNTSDLVITVYAPYEKFDYVTVDGFRLIEGFQYTAAQGSTVITLKNAYLQKLPAGDHYVQIVFDDGEEKVFAKFTITEIVDPETYEPDGFQGFARETAETTTAVTEVTTVTPATTVATSTLISPQTADAAPIAVLAALALVSAAAFVSMKKRG